MENLIKLEKAKQRKEFIKATEPGIYTGRNVDHEEIVVMVDKSGMIVKTIHPSKPNWYEVLSFDEDGFQESISYEPTNIK